MTSRGVKRRGEATKTAIASSASTVRTAQTLVTTVTVARPETTPREGEQADPGEASGGVGDDVGGVGASDRKGVLGDLQPQARRRDHPVTSTTTMSARGDRGRRRMG
jgi:hypothetical protein